MHLRQTRNLSVIGVTPKRKLLLRRSSGVVVVSPHSHLNMSVDRCGARPMFDWSSKPASVKRRLKRIKRVTVIFIFPRVSRNKAAYVYEQCSPGLRIVFHILGDWSNTFLGLQREMIFVRCGFGSTDFVFELRCCHACLGFSTVRVTARDLSCLTFTALQKARQKKKKEDNCLFCYCLS